MRSAVVIRLRCGHDTGDADGSYLGAGVCAIVPSIFRATMSASCSLHNLNSTPYYDNDSHYLEWSRLCKPTYKGNLDAVRPSVIPHGEHDWEGKVSLKERIT
jgi:hypothetical protein